MATSKNKPLKTLVFVPTYNEVENAPKMCREIQKLELDADVLFVDDNSPDGTGQALDELKGEYPRLIIHHRAGKEGIGSAHAEAIQWAYDQGYQLMVTLDCDFTHSPSDIPAMIKAVNEKDVAVGSRWARSHSLPGWSLFRRLVTMSGYILTRNLLDIPQDASGAFRAYRLDRLPRDTFKLVKSKGYSFFFESLFILNRNGFTISEIPIVLPARTYGHSKMTLGAAMKSARYIFELYFSNARRPEQFLLARSKVDLKPELIDPQDWDAYWNTEPDKSGAIYGFIAGIYRRAFIKSNLNRVIHREFPSSSKLLHAGCGSGQVDTDLQRWMDLTAVDISPGALRLYSRNNPRAHEIRHASIFELPFPDQSFDGIYNLGVMEHFTHDENVQILKEFRRVLEPGGKIVIFWPHEKATSVFVLKIAHFFLNKVMSQKKQLHPPEISLCRGREHMAEILSEAGLHLVGYEFGWRDVFIQSVVVASP